MLGLGRTRFFLWWVDPGQQPSTHTAAHSLPSPAGQGGNRRKARRLVDRDNGGLAGKAKVVHISKAKRNIHSLLPIGGPIFSYFLESRAPSCVSYLGKQTPQLLIPLLSPPFAQLFSLMTTSYGMEYSLGQFTSAVPAMYYPNFMFTPSLLSMGGWGQSEKKRKLSCFANTVQQSPNIGVLPMLFSYSQGPQRLHCASPCVLVFHFLHPEAPKVL